MSTVLREQHCKRRRPCVSSHTKTLCVTASADCVVCRVEYRRCVLEMSRKALRDIGLDNDRYLCIDVFSVRECFIKHVTALCTYSC